MRKVLKFAILQACILLFPFAVTAAGGFESDIVKTTAGPLKITFFGHASIGMEFNGKHIYIDPCTDVADFSNMPKAEIILFTHDHGDHFDLKALDELKNDNTLVVLTQICAAQYNEGIVMRNEDVKIVQGLKIEGVPAYNIVQKRPSGFPYHIKGTGNGYIITFDDKRVYIAGDTEKIPEMNELSDIDIAFLPIGPPQTMNLEMVVDAVKAIRPKIFYPYNYGDTDIAALKELLKDERDIEVRVRNMK